MSRICRFAALASRDLESILDYVAEQSSIETAESILQKINSKCSQLITFPESGRKRDELSAGVRSIPSGKYLIFYRLVETDVEILRIVSGSRELKALFDES